MTLHATSPAVGIPAGPGVGLSSDKDSPGYTCQPKVWQPQYEARFRRDVERAWSLGSAPMACLLEEVSAGRDLRAAVAEYARLANDYGGSIRDYAGDRFPVHLHVGGEQ